MFRLLGITDTACGDMHAADFRDRVRLALREPALETSVVPPPAPADAPDPRFVDLAAIPGVDNAYLIRQLNRLLAVADEALRHGTDVTWS